MSPTLKTLGIDRLSRDERLVLVQEIWDTIAEEKSGPLLTDAQRDELTRRVAADDAAPHDVVPWQEVKASLLAKLHGR